MKIKCTECEYLTMYHRSGETGRLLQRGMRDGKTFL